MKKRFLAAALLLLPAFASSDQVALSPESKIWLVGDSSLHAFSSTANNVEFTATFDPAAPTGTLFEKLRNGKLKTLDVSIPVKEMRSGKGGLDKNMQAALKAEQNTSIRFHLQNYETSTDSNTAQGFVLNAVGDLEVAGVTKKISINANVTPDGQGVHIDGTKDVLMTDHGVKPPRILMIKTENRVVVHFDLKLGSLDGKNVVDQKGTAVGAAKP